QHGAGPSEEEVTSQARPLVNVLPAEEKEVLAQDTLDEIRRELLPDGAAMLVVDDAARLIEHFPAALPGHVAEVGVFEVEGFEQAIEATQFEKLDAIEGAASAAAVEAGEEVGDRIVQAMADTQAAILPPALGEAGLFADLGGIAEEDLAGD